MNYGGTMEKSKENLRELLSHRSYICYWISGSFSMTASNLIQFVLSLYVLEKTGSAALFASMLSVVILPRILLTPVSGVVGDRFRRLSVIKSVLSATSLILLAFCFRVTFLTDEGLLWIYILVILLEMGEVFYQASESAILPEIVPLDLIPEAVSLSKIDDGIVFTLTPALGTLIFRFYGIPGGLWLTFILFLVSLGVSLFITTPFYEISEGHGPEKQRFIKMISDGLRIIGDDPFLKRIIFIVPLQFLFLFCIYCDSRPFSPCDIKLR